MMTRVEIREATEADKDGWNYVVERSQDGWLTHIFEWKYLMEDYCKETPTCRNYKPHYILAEMDSRIVGVMPDFIGKRLMYKWLYLPMGFGGPCILDDVNKQLVRKRILSYINEEARAKGILYSQILPPTPAPANLPPTENNLSWLEAFGYKLEPFYYYLLSLEPSLDELWMKLEKRARNGVRYAEKSGVRIEKGENENDVKEYYRLHLETYKRTGATPHPFSYFYNLWKYFSQRNMFHLFFAVQKEEKIAAAIILAYKGATIYNSGASLEEHLRYKPNNLIQWHVISFLKQKGYKWYEIGGVQPYSHDPKLKGIYMFKKGWGGTLVRGYMMRKEYPSPMLSLLKTLKKLKTFSPI